MRNTPCVEGWCGPSDNSSNASSPLAAASFRFSSSAVAAIISIPRPTPNLESSLSLYRPRPLRLLQHSIMRRRLILVVVRFHIILAHRMVFKFVPHQYAPQIGMAFEDNSVQVEDLPLLKLRAAPHRS